MATTQISQIDLALALFKRRKTLTPQELASGVGVDIKYASKFVSWLKRRGHAFSVAKNGRNIVSYAFIETAVTSSTQTKTGTEISSNMIDPDWDSIDVVDVRELISI